jgi:hypothetical protein
MVQADRLGGRLNLEIVPDPLTAGPKRPLHFSEPAGGRQTVEQLTDGVLAVRIGGQDLATARCCLLPVCLRGVGAAEPAEDTQSEILEGGAVRLGPLVMAAVVQERAAVQAQRLLERSSRGVMLAGSCELPAALAGRPEVVHIHVNRQPSVEGVLAVSVDHNLV